MIFETLQRKGSQTRMQTRSPTLQHWDTQQSR